MKKNNKGFTLIELLAAVVILGILVGISLPAIINVFNNSKNKIYVSDARKLIALAEYQIKANNSEIEKPDEGDVILISMRYLDTTDFDTPPGGGKYEKEKSYVVVKNDGGKLEYSASIVEKLKKGTYKGIELVKKSELVSSNALTHVVKFNNPLLITEVTTGDINESLGKNYMTIDNKISAIYNDKELKDNSSTFIISNNPTITYASVISTSGTYYNSLEASLLLKVEDKDTSKDDLQFYLSVNGDYDEAILLDKESYKYDDVFSYNIDFGKEYGMRYTGEAVELFIIVRDPDGNETRKKVTYNIHQNTPPEIEASSSVTRRDKDIYHDIPLNMLTAKVTLIVSDDIDDYSKLSVCIKESPTNEKFNKCDNYQPYYKRILETDENGIPTKREGYFGTENTMEYRFTNCPGEYGCERDGSTHYLTLFVKDSYGSVSKRKFKYTFSVNKKPEIKSFSIESRHERYTTTGSKNIIVHVEATDDVDEDSQMSVRIFDTESTFSAQYTGKDPIYHTISPRYDGQTIDLQLNVVDSERAISDPKTQKYTLYKNKPPVINSFSIESYGTACLNSALCPIEEGGSRTVRVNLDAEDDIDDDVYVCLAVGENTCKLTDYVLRKKLKTYTITANDDKTKPHIYDGSEQVVRVYVKDDYQKVVSTQSEPYKLYVNNPPVLEYAVFHSRTDHKPLSNSLYTIFNISARDDVDDGNNLKFQIIEDGVVTKEDKVGKYIGKDNQIKLAGAHDGKTRHIEVKVIDTDGVEDSKSMTYDVYKGKSPTIDLYNVYSTEIPCRNDYYCPSETSGNNNYNAKYIVKASDDIDENSEIQICVSENDSSCDNYTSYSNYLNGNTPKEMNYVFNANSTTPYDGTVKTLYLYVKDSDQNVVTSSKTYQLYTNKKPVIIKDPVITSNSTDPNTNFPDITYSIDAEDDIDENLQIKYCYKKDNGPENCTDYMDFVKEKVLNNDFFHINRPSGETLTIYSKIKDSYNAETKSKELTYKIYTDLSPSIYQSNIVSGTRIYKNNNGDELNSLEGIEHPDTYNEFTRLKIKFSVDDPYDKYFVCISTNSTTCENYQGTYDGNNCSTFSCTNTRNSHSILYDKPGFIKDGDEVKLYLFVKDSYDTTSSVELFNNTYTECEDTNVEDATYIYEFDSELTNSTYGHTNSISMDRCGGKCYYYNSTNSTTNEVFAMYKTKITYTDKFNSGITCNLEHPEEIEYEASCDFKDCFYKNDNYNRNAIGTKLVLDEEPWVMEVNEHIYNCTGHYNLYLSSYNTGDKKITLTPTNIKICNTALDNGEYNYDNNSSNPYVRVAD